MLILTESGYKPFSIGEYKLPQHLIQQRNSALEAMKAYGILDIPITQTHVPNHDNSQEWTGPHKEIA